MMKDINEVQKALSKIKGSDVNDLLIRASIKKKPINDDNKSAEAEQKEER